MDWSTFSHKQLLGLYCELMTAMYDRGVVRSSNNPVADYTETLVARSLGLKLETNSKAGFDAVSSDGTKYQIKGRRVTKSNSSTQLGAIRNIELRPFDFLAAVLYSSNLSVSYGALVPIEVVAELSRFSKHSNSHIFMFRRSVLNDPRVTEITDALVAVQSQ